MALRANHVRNYGHHARARKAGLRPQDVIVSFDGQDTLMTEGVLIEYAVNRKNPGDTVQNQISASWQTADDADQAAVNFGALSIYRFRKSKSPRAKIEGLGLLIS